MGVEIPQLDDREFEDLVEDMRKRIPVHSDAWTDHNVHDPGITFLELLAWVAESDVYRLDRLTDRHVEKYLALMGARPEPPQSATARLSLDPPADLVGTEIDPEEPLGVEDVAGRVHAFETTDPVVPTEAEVGAVVAEHRRGRTDNTTANDRDGMYFLAFGERAEAGNAMYVGFEGDPFGDADVLDLAVDFHDENLPEPASHGDEEPDFDPSVRVAWQYCTDYEHWYLEGSWADLDVARDETNRLYRGGTVRLERPTDWPTGAAEILDRAERYRWIRCVVVEDGYEVPPQLDALETNVVTARHRSTVAGETLRPADDTVLEARRRATGDGADVVPPSEPAGPAGGDARTRTTARPDQTFVFEEFPVLAATVTVGGGEPWTEVPDFDGSGPDDEEYVLEESIGAVRFGDEVRGKVPEADQAVVAERYDHGGGSAGNVSPSAEWWFERDEFADVAVSAPGGATGGRDAETVEEALTGLKRDRRTPFRAVTPADYRYVATHTPGLRFGRAAAIVERFDPPGSGGADGSHAGHGTGADGGPGDGADGGSSANGGDCGCGDPGAGSNGEGGADCETAKLVRVVVVPFGTRARPEPSTGFLEAVRCHLERHRLLTDRVTVEPPRYVGVGVTVEVDLAPGYAEAGRTTAVEEALDGFLDPLEGYDGDGWPFGRPLYVSELYETVEGVEGIDCVHDVSVAARNERGVDADGNVLVHDSALLYPTDHTVVVRGDRDACGGEP